jgi:hypothetical protein
MPRLRGLSPLARKGLLLAIAGLAGLLALAVLPYLWLGQLREEAAAQKAELALVEARVNRAQDGNPRLTEADTPERMFLPGATAGTTLAAFQSIVNDTAARSGMSVLRMQPLPTDEADGVSPYRLAVDATGSLEQLRAFLTAIESSLPVIIVSGFEIEPRSSEGPAAQPYPSEDLAVTLKLEAYAWRGAP